MTKDIRPTPKTKKTTLVTKTKLISLADPNDVVDFANTLKQIIIENKLYTNLSGKNYVNVEGWQIAGAFVGLYPVVEKVEDVRMGAGHKYRAEVSIRDQKGDIAGYGVAICSSNEPGRSKSPEYVIASMAQTRAVGKAFRLRIGWLLKLAGYEATPLEEMKTPSPREALDTDELLLELSGIDSEADLLKHYYHTRASYGVDDAIKRIYAERKAAIRGEAVDERDWDSEAKSRRDASEASALQSQATNYEIERESSRERALSNG